MTGSRIKAVIKLQAGSLHYIMKKTIIIQLIIILFVVIGHAAVCTAQSGDMPKDDWPTVGIEAAIKISLPYPDLKARSVTKRTDLILRIAGARSEDDGKTVYDLRYIGLIPGTCNLENYLVTSLGQEPDGLPSIPVTIRPLLPEDHEGDLVSRQLRGITLPGGYRAFFVTVWVVWALLLIPIIVIGRPRKQKKEVDEEVHQPTLAELLRPLVEHALDGRLDTSGKARLERLLMNYWCEKLDLDETQVLASLEKIKAHPDAGAILREQECWLHQPPGRSKVDVASLLSPYRHIYIEKQDMEGAV